VKFKKEKNYYYIQIEKDFTHKFVFKIESKANIIYYL
jgi:hypothetical protein